MVKLTPFAIAAVALLGASYGFVHLADAMGDRRVTLPPRSVVIPKWPASALKSAATSVAT